MLLIVANAERLFQLHSPLLYLQQSTICCATQTLSVHTEYQQFRSTLFSKTQTLYQSQKSFQSTVKQLLPKTSHTVLIGTKTFAQTVKCADDIDPIKCCTTMDVDRTTDVRWKIKFSHTSYRALGPELIPVYRQSARSWREVNHAIIIIINRFV